MHKRKTEKAAAFSVFLITDPKKPGILPYGKRAAYGF